MDTLPFKPLELIAIDTPRNIRRCWRVAAYHDLFGQVMIETSWGRIGGRGRELVRSFVDEAEALRYVRALLARRGTATRRIGVGYLSIDPTFLGVDMPTIRAFSAPVPSWYI